MVLMSRFDFDRGMGIRGIGGTRPTSFEYMPPQRDPIVDAIVSRRDANDSINRATDQYEADVADFKNTAATEKEEGTAGQTAQTTRTATRAKPRG